MKRQYSRAKGSPFQALDKRRRSWTRRTLPCCQVASGRRLGQLTTIAGLTNDSGAAGFPVAALPSGSASSGRLYPIRRDLTSCMRSFRARTACAVRHRQAVFSARARRQWVQSRAHSISEAQPEQSTYRSAQNRLSHKQIPAFFFHIQPNLPCTRRGAGRSPRRIDTGCSKATLPASFPAATRISKRLWASESAIDRAPERPRTL